MKTLERFSDLKISAEEQELVNGGYKVAGSGIAPNGSKYTYDGDLSMSGAGENSISGQLFGVNSRDFSGRACLDGVVCNDNFFTPVP